MTSAEQNVKRQYPEAVCNQYKYNGLTTEQYTIRADGLYFIGWHNTPEDAWAEAERNLTKEKEK